VAGADALCLTELTTHTGWMGYSTANSNGWLNATHVHAFIRSGNKANILTPLTTYYFANAGNGAAGGASFTTDSNGDGPNDNAQWSAANYFNGDYVYWTGNNPYGCGTSTSWHGGWLGDTCATWGTASSSVIGEIGESTYTDATRWCNWDYGHDCSSARYLICYVNP
jgi:hypothetical protein